MNSSRLSFWLFAAGIAALIGAIFWSLYAFGLIGQLVVSKGLRPNAIGHCLMVFTDFCSGLNAAHAERGTTPYSPWLFWAGVAAIVASFVVALRQRSAGESWPSRLQHLLLPVDRVSTFVGQLFAWCILLLTFAISYEVFMRKVMRAPTEWAYDASYILYGALFIMAGAYALCRNAHVRGDFIYRAWPARRQAAMDLVLYVLFFFPGMIAFIYAGYGFAAQAWMVHEHSAYSPGGPPIYHYKTLIPATGVLMVMQGIVESVRCVVCLATGQWPSRLHDVEELEKVILEQHAEGKS